MELDYTLLGQQIKKIRKQRHLSQKDLAQKTKVTAAHISHIERANTKLSLQTLVDIAEALEVPTDSIIYGGSMTIVKRVDDTLLEKLSDCTEQEAKILLAFYEQIRTIMKATPDAE